MASPSARAPAFRVEQIGSLLRPQYLIDAMARKIEGSIGNDELQALQDKAIDDVIKMQEDIGLPCITDGEFRRISYTLTFLRDCLGLSSMIRSSEDALVIDRRVSWKPTLVKEFEYLKAHTDRVGKITQLGPCRVHWGAWGRKNISKEIYPDLALFWDDVIDAERKEVDALAKAGCTYIQIDDTTLAKFGDEKTRAKWAAVGEPLDELLPIYIDALNRVVRDPPPDMAFGLHTCRGNSAHHSLGFIRPSGGYDSVAERMFSELEFSTYFLEYDTPRAGDFSPLRFLPKGKIAVLGLVSTKVPELETADQVLRRIEEATKFIDVDQLAISPQCGFASDFTGHPLNIGQEEAKLRLIVEVAERVWGSA